MNSDQAERDFRNQQAKAEAEKQADAMTRQAYPPPHVSRVNPRIEQTQAGAQTVIDSTPPRKVPETGLKPKKAQTNKPTLLEMYEEEVKQPKLF